MRRKPTEERWNPEMLNEVVGLPLRLSANDPDVGGEARAEVVRMAPRVLGERIFMADATVPRSFRI